MILSLFKQKYIIILKNTGAVRIISHLSQSLVLDVSCRSPADVARSCTDPIKFLLVQLDLAYYPKSTARGEVYSNTYL